jgi:hypothetical protein
MGWGNETGRAESEGEGGGEQQPINQRAQHANVASAAPTGVRLEKLQRLVCASFQYVCAGKVK